MKWGEGALPGLLDQAERIDAQIAELYSLAVRARGALAAARDVVGVLEAVGAVAEARFQIGELLDKRCELRRKIERVRLLGDLDWPTPEARK